MGPGALDAAKYLAQVGWVFVGRDKGKVLVECFGLWMHESRPDRNGLLNFEDVTLALRADHSDSTRQHVLRITKMKKDPLNNCHLHIPIGLAVKASDDAADRLRMFLCTPFAGLSKRRMLDMAMEALPCYGQPLPQRTIVFVGDGKSSRTLFRANVLGAQHVVISAECFQKPDEFRSQGWQFAFATAATIQECRPGCDLIEAIWKNCVSGQLIAARPLFGKETLYLRWHACAKNWEVHNFLPSISASPYDVKSLKSFVRRLLVVKVASAFTSDPAVLDPEQRVFWKIPPSLLSWKGPTRLAYMQSFMIPFLQRYSEGELHVNAVKSDTLNLVKEDG